MGMSFAACQSLSVGEKTKSMYQMLGEAAANPGTVVRNFGVGERDAIYMGTDKYGNSVYYYSLAHTIGVYGKGDDPNQSSIPDKYGGVEAYRAYQAYPFEIPGETWFDRACRRFAAAHREEMLNFGGGGYNMFGGYGRAAQVAEVANAVPARLARVVPADINSTTLGAPGSADVFVTAADDIAGLNAGQIANRLTIPNSSTGFKVIEFNTPSSGLGSPINRINPSFVGFGRTAGGAREFTLPNQPIPGGSLIKIIR